MEPLANNPPNDSALPVVNVVASPVGKRAEAEAGRANPAPERPVPQPDEHASPRRTLGERLAEMLRNSSSLMASFAVHMIAIILLALITMPLPEVIRTNLLSLPSDSLEELDELPIDPSDEPLVEVEPTELEIQPDTNVISDEVSFSPYNDMEAAASAVSLSDLGVNTAPEHAAVAVNGFDGKGLSGRGQASRMAMVRKGGGSQASEEAVALALNWLATHQNPNGTWFLDHTGGECQGQCKNPGELRDSTISATSLALLPFLGAGQTHKEGKYQQTVAKGLDALVKLGQRSQAGTSWMDGGNMYAHGLAAITLCEAYGMTDDYRLMTPAQNSLDFIVYAQDPSLGGWRYQPRRDSDTSVAGWQIMALKSGHLANLGVPASTIAKASAFLDAVAIDYGAGYVYVVDNKQYRASTSAVGLLCRMYIDWKQDRAELIAGVNRLAERGPSQNDFYYNYYATQVLFQFTGGEGELWQKWNTAMRDHLVASQGKQGHERGSWFLAHGDDSDKGGRLYMTSLATMTLEVYYRYMPIYQTEAVDSAFPE